ncbi:DUF502 domain-containing protein [Natrinema salsiterrestre]|uniref:DUF502 domain-containing protein n=1 Tax=Natrinema salsiterrestre TaxID=2950540 RepID=A0A9Q4L0G9_9EURY|nr:DUF502 domain-containing protein [Natrinema salsiterrestre]MDF9745254.1 DUF502 domain-containing protein [Natrinema salsiterrestre]
MNVSAAIKSSFIAGLILVAPLVVTLYVLRFLVNWTVRFVDPVVDAAGLTRYTANVEIVAQLLAVAVILAAIVALGFLAQRSVGRHLFGNVGRLVNVVPLVSTIYSSVRQVADALVERRTAYESVVLVEYPREDVYMIGLVTGESPEAVADFAGGDVYNVFLPNSPNPTGGKLVLLSEDQVHEIDMSVRRGMRLIVTTGMGEERESATLPTLDSPAAESPETAD